MEGEWKKDFVISHPDQHGNMLVLYNHITNIRRVSNEKQILCSRSNSA